MLNVPQLDDMTFNSMFERARRMIPRLNVEWTDLNHHDPGITTLQMFYWLIDTLNYYLDATGEQHRLKYLKLLGISSVATPAYCYVAVQGENIRLPKGTKMYADDVVFETVESFSATNNAVVAIYNEINEEKRDVTRFAGVDGSFAELFSLNSNDSCNLYIGFENSFSGNFDVYIEVASTLRNYFSSNFSLANYRWEYYDGTDYVPCNLIKDETCGFLKTGFIKLSIDKPIVKYMSSDMQDGYYLRCKILSNEFDVLPSIGRILTACIKVKQTNTYADSYIVKYDADKEMTLDFSIRENDNVIVARKEGDIYREWFNSEADDNICKVVRGETVNESKIIFNKDTPNQGDEFVVFICDTDIKDSVMLGTTDGCAGQRFRFDAQSNSISELSLALVKEDGITNEYELWDYCEDISSRGYDSRCFGYDREDGCIYFGDSINGIQPQQGLNVMITTVKTSKYEGGNVLKGTINSIEDGYAYEITNLENATGGNSRKNSTELEKEIEGKINAVTRAVTAEDYKNIVMNTPGLMIDSMNVISIKDYCDSYNEPYYSNTVIIAVKPKFGGERPILSESYKKNIASNLNKYRLLTTEIKVIPARYVGVSVYGRITLTNQSDYALQEIYNFLHRQIDQVKNGDFGKTVDYGRLFSALELHANVRTINDLSLEYSGNGGYKNEQGDIVIRPDSLSYLNEIGIEFV